VGFVTPVRFRFDEGTGDTATDDYNGIVATSLFTGYWAQGKIGQWAMDSTLNNILVAPIEPALMPAHGITVALWHKPNGSGNGSLINIKYGLNASYSIYINSTDQISTFITFDDGATSSDTQNTPSLTVGNWYFIVLRWGQGLDTECRVYNEDGSLFVSRPGDGGDTQDAIAYTGTNDLYIGGREHDAQRAEGPIDDLRIYHHRLSDADIAALIPPLAYPARLVLRSAQASSTSTLSQSAKPARLILRAAQGSASQAGIESAKPARLVLRSAQASSTGTLSQSANPARLVLWSAQASSTGELSQSAKPAKLILRTVVGSGSGNIARAAKPARLVLRSAQASSTGALSQSANPSTLVLRTSVGTGVLDGAPISRAAKPARIVFRSRQASFTGEFSVSAKPARLVLRTAQGSGQNLISQAASPARIVLRAVQASSSIGQSAKPARLVLRAVQGSWNLDQTASAKPARLVLRALTGGSAGKILQSAKPARIVFRTVSAGAIVGDLSHVIYYAVERAGNYFLAVVSPRIHTAASKVKHWMVK
jgi:hypothetical protein